MDWDEKIKLIPPGSIVFVWGYNLLGRIISWYENWEWHTKNEDYPSHIEMYFGSGNHEDISAEAAGVRIKSIDRFKNDKIEVYSYTPLTVNQLQVLKAFMYGRVGRAYDYLGLVHFLGNLVGKKLPQSKYASFCSELIGEAFDYLDLPFCDSVPPCEQTPARQWEWVRNNKDWKKIF